MLCRRKAPRIIIRFSFAAAKSVADNDDLLLQILLRLPIRSLLRFKSVSKRWLALISNPNFSHRRIISHPLTPSGIFLSCSRPISPKFDFVDLRPNPSRVPFESLQLSTRKHGIVILQSCNGLLLCCKEGLPRSDYYILNPTTKQYTTLRIDRIRAIAGLNLAFDPLRSPNYKVICVRLVSESSESNYEIEIYSSDSCFWRPCGSNGAFSAPFMTQFDCGVYWNGSVHWITNCENCQIIYFDLCEEKLHETPIPRAFDGWEGRRMEYFGNCGGNLNWIESSGRQSVLNVYEMKNDHGGWFLKYRVDLHWVSSLFPQLSLPTDPGLDYSKFTVLTIVDRSEVEVEVDDGEAYVVIQSLGNVVRVNVKNGSFERLVCSLNDGGITTKFPMGFGIIDGFLYIESLACV